MSRTMHTSDRRTDDGYVRIREPRPTPRRQGTRVAVVRTELSRDMPAVRAALRGA